MSAGSNKQFISRREKLALAAQKPQVAPIGRIPVHVCLQCHHTWRIRTNHPVATQCPSCRSPFWKVPRQGNSAIVELLGPPLEPIQRYDGTRDVSMTIDAGWLLSTADDTTGTRVSIVLRSTGTIDVEIATRIEDDGLVVSGMQGIADASVARARQFLAVRLGEGSVAATRAWQIAAARYPLLGEAQQ